MGSTNEDYVGRVDQIDSAELDNEFLSGKHKSKNFMSIDKCVIRLCRVRSIHMLIIPKLFYIPGVIISKLEDVFRLLSPSSVIHRLKPELSFLLKLTFYYFTICTHKKATLGQQLIGFCYKVGFLSK